MKSTDLLPIGQLAARVGVSVSAIRFYEEQGLIMSSRTSGGQRRFSRADIRRLSFIMIAQQFGFTIEQIREQLDGLPSRRTPTKDDWTKMSKGFKKTLDEKIEMLSQLRNKLDGCIGCGCLSLRNCALYNPEDKIGGRGTGPRYLLGDKPITVAEE